MKKFLFSVKHRSTAAIVCAAIIICSFSGCSSQMKEQAQSLSSLCQNIASQIQSSFDDASHSLSEAVSSAIFGSSGGGPAPSVYSASKASAVSPNPGKSDVQSVKKITSGIPASSTPKKKVTAVSAPASHYSKIQQNSEYQNLSDGAERELYQLIGSSVYQIAYQKSSSGYYPMAQISCSGDVSEAQIRVAMTAYMDDNPQIFWLADVYGFGTQGGNTVLQLYSVESPAECSVAISRFDAAVASAVRSVPSGLSEFGREECLFNYLVGHCSYDNAAVTDNSRWQAFTSYGAIVDGSAVCEGYSRAMQLLAGDVGLNCTLVRGSSNGAGHMWDQIKIDGAWYNLDVTWCDNSITIYNYYNITDSVLSQTHNIGSSVTDLSEAQINSGSVQYNVVLHSCKSTEANYFKYKGISVSTLNGSEDTRIVKSLSSDLRAGNKSVAFLIGGDYDANVEGMVSGKLSDWLADAEKQTGKSLVGGTKYVTDQADRGLTIQISYR